MAWKNMLAYTRCLVLILCFSTASALGANILFVAADETETSYPGDALIKAFMEDLGHTVTYFDDNKGAAEMQDAAWASDLVFIGESSLSGNARQKITTVERPMIWSEYAAWDEEGLTAGGGGGSDVATTDITIVNPDHFLAAGFDSGRLQVITGLMGMGRGNAAGTTELLRHSHNLAGDDATVIAKVTLADGRTYDMIFVYEKGGRLPRAPADGSPQVAADMRICFGFDYKIENWHANAFTLLEAAINYALGIVAPPGIAKEPHPAADAADVSRDVILTWEAGDFAPAVNGHIVYLGENVDDVNEASGGAAQDEASYEPGRLTFDTTYYWRVDEVNGPPDFTVHRGVIWSFSTEPFSIPINNVTAIASSSFGPSLPENTISGSGLVGDLHNTSANDMWISTGVPATIEYAFDKAYKLHELWVWNSNQLIEPFVGFGAKDIIIEHSLDAVTWTLLDGVGPLAQGPGAEGYAHNNVIDLGGATAQHVRLTVNSVQGFATQASLSEVRFFTIPTLATRPSPEDGDIDVDPGTTLSWGRNGREAERHDVYFGTDPDNLALAGTVTESSFDTGALGLVLGESYHWRVDEVNDAMVPGTWKGSAWSFSTVDRIVVDDMESYEDKEFLEIWATWVDGFEDPTNGSLVGNGGAGLPETTITHGGGQSLPLHYDNSGSGLSETTRTFSPAQDWTVGAPETLVLHFQGALANSGGGQVYVKINNTQVTYDANLSAISSPFWTQWNIDLAGVGMVNSLTIGVEGAGAQGILYVDDLILYRQAPEPVAAQDPGTDNLVAYYPLDNTAQDGSGNGHNGTLEGSPIYLSPGWDGTGACMQFGPQDARITVESFDVTGSGVTLAAWINPSLFTNDARMISKSDGGSTANHYWAMVLSGGGENNLQFRLRTDDGATTSHTSSGSPLQTDEWTHVAVTWDASDPIMRLYKNVQQISSTAKAGTAVATGAGVKIGIGNQSISALAQGPGNEIRPFDGLVDEVRIYDRGLSVAELIYVAFGQ